MPRSAEAVTRVLLRLQPDLIETGDAGPCGWAAVHAARRLGVPLVGFYHSDLPQLVRKRFGSAAGRMAQQYVRRLYRHCDLLLAPSAAMVRRLATLGLHAHQQPLRIDTVIFHPQRAHGNLRADLGFWRRAMNWRCTGTPTWTGARRRATCPRRIGGACSRKAKASSRR
jgi:alpha-1,6-mannosyltransferase